MTFTDAHKVTAIVALCAVLSWSCVQPTDPEPVQEVAAQPAPVEEPEAPSSPEIPDDSAPAEEPEPEPAWQPDAGTLYLFTDYAGGELYHSETPTADRWASRVRAYRLTADKYGYVFVAGTPPEAG